MKRRLFLIFHADGIEDAQAVSAREALENTFVPGGAKAALAVIDAAALVVWHRPFGFGEAGYLVKPSASNMPGVAVIGHTPKGARS